MGSRWPFEHAARHDLLCHGFLAVSLAMRNCNWAILGDPQIVIIGSMPDPKYYAHLVEIAVKDSMMDFD